MKLKLIREIFTPTSTVGSLYIDGKLVAFVLEDVVRPKGEKVDGKTAIPYGTYAVTYEKSPRLSKLKGHDFFTPRLQKVPGYSGILLHSGNTAEDSIGCLILGLQRQKDRVTASRDACDRVYPLIEAGCAAGKVTIEIVDGRK
ncbi:DUF5675 family protein [Hymenobacter siberiensis]|uniref:DUF5675 family protein n=1 Tax=Hymenobacter siberiensis TaxID=2848396 RepID=UPI001C1E57FB|nr:DUF5675 family protein [Hymenobacter siberiensis]